MRQIFIFTAGDSKARKHIADSIASQVPIKLLDDCLSRVDAYHIKSILPEVDGFYAWGSVPGKQNVPRWDAMREGDIVLTVFANHYRYVSTVIAKAHSEALAREIWGESSEGKTWEYMYFLTKPEPVNLSVMSDPVANFLNKSYFGFSRISDDKVKNICKTYRTLRNFIEQEFVIALPPNAASRAIFKVESINKKNDNTFDPSNLVDGKEKVLREIVQRRGQPKFRKQLLMAYENCCAVTGCTVENVLEAAHILAYAGEGTNHVSNGLLLRADIHTLFDLGELRVDSKGRIHLSDELSETEYSRYDGTYIRMPEDVSKRPSSTALEIKFKQGG